MYVEYVRAVLATAKLFFFKDMIISSYKFFNNSGGWSFIKTSLWLHLQSTLFCPCPCVPLLLLCLAIIKCFLWISCGRDAKVQLIVSVWLISEKQCLEMSFHVLQAQSIMWSSAAFDGLIFPCLRSRNFTYHVGHKRHTHWEGRWQLWEPWALTLRSIPGP